jgi:predicted dehydrogenase
MSASLSVLIVGCGRIAGGFDESRTREDDALSHAGAYSKRTEVTLAACVDPDISVAERFAERWSVAGAYSACDEIPESREFDIVSICTPTDFHSSSVEGVFRFRPKVIFLEKPVSASAETSQQLLEKCREQKVGLIVNYSRRWDSRLASLRSSLTQKEAAGSGSLRAVNGVYNKGIRNNGSHILDLLASFVGPLQPEWAAVRPANTRECDPDIDMMLISDSGIRCSLISTDSEDFSQFELTFLMSEGELRMLDGGLRWSERTVESSPEFAGYKRLSKEVDIAGGYLPVMERAISEVIEFAQDPQAAQKDYRAAERAVETERLIEKILEMANE